MGLPSEQTGLEKELPTVLRSSESERTEVLRDWVAQDMLVLEDLLLSRRISEHAAEVLQAVLH
jgi:hypothetical protein